MPCYLQPNACKAKKKSVNIKRHVVQTFFVNSFVKVFDQIVMMIMCFINAGGQMDAEIYSHEK